jgi:hypothetical protein
MNLFDKYNPQTNTWTPLPSAPTPRDHAGAGIVRVATTSTTSTTTSDGESLLSSSSSSFYDLYCVAGGRRSNSVDNFFNAVVLPTDCFNFTSSTWHILPSIPQGRAGAAYGTTCDSKLMVAGGEGFGRAWETVHVFDGSSWSSSLSLSLSSVPNLTMARHGISGLVMDCRSFAETGTYQVYLASGHGTQGGSGKDLVSMEVLTVMTKMTTTMTMMTTTSNHHPT